MSRFYAVNTTECCRAHEAHKRWMLQDASGKCSHMGTQEGSLTGE